MRIATLALTIAATISATADSQSADKKGCGDHICTATEGHKFVEYRKGGTLIDCRIEHVAHPISSPYGFIVVASAGEGTILPYMLIVVRGVRITPVNMPNEKLALRSVRIVGAETNFDTRDWQAQVREGAAWLRMDVLPEDRSPVATLATIATSQSYAMRVETADGQELRVGVAQLRPTGDTAQRFLACTEELRKAVGG